MLLTAMPRGRGPAAAAVGAASSPPAAVAGPAAAAVGAAASPPPATVAGPGPAAAAASPPPAAVAGAASTSAKSSSKKAKGPRGGDGRARGGEATTDRYDTIIKNKWMCYFAEEAEMTVEEARTWVDPITHEVNEVLITRFLTWIGDGALDGLVVTRQENGRATQYEFTANLYSTALKAAAKHLSSELSRNGLSKKAKGFITSLPGIGEFVANIKDGKVAADNDDCVDLQAEIREQKIDPEKNLRCFNLLWGFDPTLDLAPIPRLVLHVTRTFTEALVARGEDARFHHLASMFTKQLPGVGPTREGAVALCFVTNQGKVNRSGRRMYTGGLPHYNPLLDFVSAIGHDFVYRWQVSKERCPNFGDFTTMFAAKLCRSSQSCTHSASYESQLDAFKALWKCLDVAPQEKTHYGRGAAHVNLDERNVLPEFIDRLANRLFDAKHSSYTLNLPRDALLGSAACPGDVRNHACYNPPHTSVQISDDALFELLPWLKAERAKLHAALLEAEGMSFAEKKKARLFCLQGGFDAIKFVVSTLIQVAAARPRDARGVIVATSKRMCELFTNNPVFHFSSRPARPFLRFVARLRPQRTSKFRASTKALLWVCHQLPAGLKLLSARGSQPQARKWARCSGTWRSWLRGIVRCSGSNASLWLQSQMALYAAVAGKYPFSPPRPQPPPQPQPQPPPQPPPQPLLATPLPLPRRGP